MKNEITLTQKSLFKALNPPLNIADVMGVRWLRAVASFILLKTKKGRDFYITFPNLSNTNITPIARTPMNIFLGVKILFVVLFFIALPFASSGSNAPFVRDNAKSTSPLYGTPLVVVTPTEDLTNRDLPASANCELDVAITPSTISPFLNCFVRYTHFGAAIPAGAGTVFTATPLPALSRVNLYFAITNYLKDYTCKYTKYCYNFYKFAKFEVRGLFVFNKIKFPITDSLWNVQLLGVMPDRYYLVEELKTLKEEDDHKTFTPKIQVRYLLRSKEANKYGKEHSAYYKRYLSTISIELEYLENTQKFKDELMQDIHKSLNK